MILKMKIRNVSSIVYSTIDMNKKLNGILRGYIIIRGKKKDIQMNSILKVSNF
jgi:hypothetical protein